ncbi:MAG: TetR/AcrR family transcriptional regulator [Actinomycetota bacterium]
MQTRQSPALTARGALTRSRIVDAAADLMYAAGVAGTSLDQVTAASRTSRSQLYHYFADKDDLVAAVIQRQTERVLQVQRTLLEDLSSMAGLRAWADAVVRSQDRLLCVGGCPLGSLAAELAASEDARRLLTKSFEQWERLLAAGFTAMQRGGELDEALVPEDLATSVLAAAQGGLLLTDTTRSTRPLRLALDLAIDRMTVRSG